LSNTTVNHCSESSQRPARLARPIAVAPVVCRRMLCGDVVRCAMRPSLVPCFSQPPTDSSSSARLPDLRQRVCVVFSAVAAGLDLVEVGVPPSGVQQFFVGALLDHPSVVDDDDGVGGADGGEAVRDEERDATLSLTLCGS
jgi:hypothetical protein